MGGIKRKKKIQCHLKMAAKVMADRKLGEGWPKTNVDALLPLVGVGVKTYLVHSKQKEMEGNVRNYFF